MARIKDYYHRWLALWHPERFHGWGKRRAYFEGWYFKMVAKEGQAALALIPGIAYDEKGETHAFIQLLDGKGNKASYHRFPTNSFQPDPDRFGLQLGDNYFGAEGLRVKIPELEADVNFQHPVSWPKSQGAPGVMGWYSFVPFMECYHGVVSLHHHLEGQINLNGQPYDLNGGIGYLEKDWGRSFPSSWVWMQSNHFDTNDPCCLMVSVARIPWLGSHFVGFLAGFLWEGRLIRMTTYTGAKMRLSIQDKSVLLQLSQGKYRLEIEGIPGPGTDLVSPVIGNMTGKINESLQGKLKLKFYQNKELVFAGTGKHAGLELSPLAAIELQQ